MRLSGLALAVLLAACASAPKPAPAVAAAPEPAGPVELKPIPGPVDVLELPFSAAATEVEVSGGTGEVIEFAFGWPAGAEADLHFSASKTYSFAGAPSSVQLARGVIALAAEGVPADHPTRLAIRTSTRSIETEGDERELPGLMLNLAVALPLESAWAVDGDGLLVELPTAPDVDALVERMFSARNVAMDPGMRRALRQMLTPEVVQARAAEFWGAIVGGWAGGKVELGAMYRMRTREVQPNGVAYTATVELQAVGRVPCSAGEPEASCVRFELRSRADEAATAAMMAPMLEQQRLLIERAGHPRELIAAVDLADELVLIAEPDGLFPRQLVQRRRTTPRYEGPAPRGFPTETVDERVATFEWLAR